jgi:hypothetical protein
MIDQIDSADPTNQFWNRALIIISVIFFFTFLIPSVIRDLLNSVPPPRYTTLLRHGQNKSPVDVIVVDCHQLRGKDTWKPTKGPAQIKERWPGTAPSARGTLPFSSLTQAEIRRTRSTFYSCFFFYSPGINRESKLPFWDPLINPIFFSFGVATNYSTAKVWSMSSTES